MNYDARTDDGGSAAGPALAIAGLGLLLGLTVALVAWWRLDFVTTRVLVRIGLATSLALVVVGVLMIIFSAAFLIIYPEIPSSMGYTAYPDAIRAILGGVPQAIRPGVMLVLAGAIFYVGAAVADDGRLGDGSTPIPARPATTPAPTTTETTSTVTETAAPLPTATVTTTAPGATTVAIVPAPPTETVIITTAPTAPPTSTVTSTADAPIVTGTDPVVVSQPGQPAVTYYPTTTDPDALPLTTTVG